MAQIGYKTSSRKSSGTKASKPIVVQQIVVQAPQRRVYDIGDWRSALRSADNGRPKYLYDLFEDIMIDGVLADAINKRIEAVLNAEVVFMNARGQEEPAIAAMIDTTAWETLIREIMHRLFYGRAGVELFFNSGFHVEPIKPKYIDLDNCQILLNDTGDRSVPYDQDPNLLVVGRPGDYGLLLKAAPYAIWKRGGFGDYAQWIELFGMPQRIGKYNTFDPQSRELLKQALEEAGSAPYLVIPKEADIETKEVNRGSGSSFNEFRQATNEEMLITILGQTLTTIQGERGARSLGEVHLQVEDSKHTSDLRFVQRTLNERLLPVLETCGLPVKGGRFVYPKAADPLSVDEIVKLSTIIDIPVAFIHDKYSIPMPDKGEVIAGEKSNMVLGSHLETDTDVEEKVRNADNRNIWRRLWDFFIKAPQGGAFDGTALMRMQDSDTLEERLMGRVAASQPAFDTELFRFLSEDLLKAVQPEADSIGNADIGVVYGVRDDALQTAMEINLFQFSAAKTLAELQELNRLFRESSNFADFEREARKICTAFNRDWQRTEYDTALLTAEAASTYRRLMGKTKLFPYWEYRTVGDDRVRPSHRQLEGIVLPYNDARWKKIFPPNDWRCRCRVVPRMAHEVKKETVEASQQRVDEFFGTATWKKAAAQGWGVNRALTGEVFTQNQFYIRRFQNKASKLLGRLYYNDWGLDSFAKRLAAATEPMPEYSGSAAEWYEAHKTLHDYKGREVVMDEKVFRTHTTGNYEKVRVPLLACVEEVLKNPDEVWLNDYHRPFRNMNFIKFYDGKVIDVICEVDENLEYRITTWFEIVQTPNLKQKTRSSRHIDPRWRYRRGLLIKKS
ncbi:phage portal protein family protein [Alistipes putredinis]|uniref:phage portal protein family protein n=1 Tax=Alistipes putredinis TaxID=28117 RepID=UPI003AAC4AAD